MRKDYVKLEVEIYYGTDGYYTKKTKAIIVGKLSEGFLDDLWDNDSIEESTLKRISDNKEGEK